MLSFLIACMFGVGHLMNPTHGSGGSPPPVGNPITTEAGSDLQTESGSNIITE